MYVGDIGDNRRERDEVVVYRVPVGRGQLDVEPASFRLAYPDGPHDAESLFADRAGRLHVITKSFRRRDRLPRPEAAGPESASTGSSRWGESAATSPTRRCSAVGGTCWCAACSRPRSTRCPTSSRSASFALPWQPQGEGVSVGPDGRIRISTEGAGTPVYEVALPAAVAPDDAATRTAPTASASPEAVDPPGGVGRVAG